MLALEAKWRENFKLGWDNLKQARMWICLLNLPLQLWEWEKIIKIVPIAGTLLFLDKWK